MPCPAESSSATLRKKANTLRFLSTNRNQASYIWLYSQLRKSRQCRAGSDGTVAVHVTAGSASPDGSAPGLGNTAIGGRVSSSCRPGGRSGPCFDRSLTREWRTFRAPSRHQRASVPGLAPAIEGMVPGVVAEGLRDHAPIPRRGHETRRFGEARAALKRRQGLHHGLYRCFQPVRRTGKAPPWKKPVAEGGPCRTCPRVRGLPPDKVIGEPAPDFGLRQGHQPPRVKIVADDRQRTDGDPLAGKRRRAQQIEILEHRPVFGLRRVGPAGRQPGPPAGLVRSARRS